MKLLRRNYHEIYSAQQEKPTQEITTRTDSAAVNIWPYRLSEKHDKKTKEINFKIRNKVLLHNITLLTIKKIRRAMDRTIRNLRKNFRH